MGKYCITGTHDIQNVHVSSPLPGQIKVTGDFVDGSTVTGVMLIVYSLAGKSDVLEGIDYIVEDKSGRNISIVVTGLSRAEYSLAVSIHSIIMQCTLINTACIRFT